MKGPLIFIAPGHPLMKRAARWRSERGQLSGSLASLRKHDAEGANILRDILNEFNPRDPHWVDLTKALCASDPPTYTHQTRLGNFPGPIE